jgi:hypothetical protein
MFSSTSTNMQFLTLFWCWSFAIPILHLIPKDMIKPAQDILNLLVFDRFRTFYKFSFQLIPKYPHSISFFFQVKQPRCADRNKSIDKIQSNTTINICIAKRCFYIASFNNDMFRQLYWPSSGCTLAHFKANYTINNVFCFCQRDFLHIYKTCI